MGIVQSSFHDTDTCSGGPNIMRLATGLFQIKALYSGASQQQVSVTHCQQTSQDSPPC